MYVCMYICIHSYINFIGRTCAYMIYSCIPGEAVPAVGFGFGDAVVFGVRYVLIVASGSM